MGYNYFVDRFGRIWAGRRGADGDRDTRGAHTLGFNHTSVGIAVLGSYQEAAPTPKVLAGVAKIAAWKLRKYHRDPLATTPVLSHGSVGGVLASGSRRGSAYVLGGVALLAAAGHLRYRAGVLR